MQAARHLRVSVRTYRGPGWRSFADVQTWDRVCKLFGWPQTFIGRKH